MKTDKNHKLLFFLTTLHQCFYVCLMLFLPQHLQSQTRKTWQWVAQLGGTGWDKTCGVSCDSKNNLYVAGSFHDTLQCGTRKIKSLGNQDIFIAKFNESGDVKGLWTAGGTDQDQATSLCTTPGDNIAIGGSVTGSVTFGTLSDNGNGHRIFVANMDDKGAFTWLTTLNGDATLFLIACDSLGSNIYVSGTFTGTLEGNGQKVTSNGKKDIFLARITCAGTLEKLVSYGGTDDDAPGSLSVSNAGVVSMAGSFGKSFALGAIQLTSIQARAKTNVFVVQFNQDLTAQWATIFSGGEYCQASSLRHDRQGNLYVAGSFNLNLWAGDTVFTSKGNTDAFLLKLSTTGKLQWGKSFGTWYYDYANHVNIDNLGGAIITGSMGDTLVVDSLEIIPTSKGTSTMVLQFTATGKTTWGDCISGKGRSFSDGSVLDKKGNLYLTGSFRNTFEKGIDGLTSFGDQDVFLAKYYNCPTAKAEVYGLRQFCPGLGTELSVKRGFTDITWNDTITGTNTILASAPSRYWVNMYDKQGCLLADTLDIIQALLPVFTLGQDTTLLVGDSLLLKAPVMYNQYHWQDYSSGYTYLAQSTDKKTGTSQYWLTVTDSLYCTYTDTITIHYVKDLQWVNLNQVQLVAYPNPVNDIVYWYLKTSNPCQVVVKLTDENGRVLYHQYIEQYFPGQVMQVSMGHRPVGPYYIRLEGPASGQDFKTVRIIKQ
jgi:hypothetical protein